MMQIENELVLNEEEWNKISTLEPDKYYSATKEGYIICPVKEK
jgi:hypothetical protein